MERRLKELVSQRLQANVKIPDMMQPNKSYLKYGSTHNDHSKTDGAVRNRTPHLPLV